MGRGRKKAGRKKGGVSQSKNPMVSWSKVLRALEAADLDKKKFMNAYENLKGTRTKREPSTDEQKAVRKYIDSGFQDLDGLMEDLGGVTKVTALTALDRCQKFWASKED